jgi:hypothetical protein
VLIMLALTVWMTPQTAFVISLVIAVVAGVWTQSAQSRRVAFGDRWYAVQPGAFDRLTYGDVLLIDGQYPSTFLLADNLPEGIRVHVVQKDYTGTPLQDWLEQEIADAPSAWVVTGRPGSQVDPIVGTIDYQNCSRIRSNVVDRWLCPFSL